MEEVGENNVTFVGFVTNLTGEAECVTLHGDRCQRDLAPLREPSLGDIVSLLTHADLVLHFEGDLWGEDKT